jgi:hypothetical protein
MSEINNDPPIDQVPIAFGAVEMQPVNAQTVLLLNRRSGSQGFVSADVANALGRCREFRTSSQHARAIAGASASEEARSDVARTLETLARQGLLLRADTILEDIVSGEPPAHRSTRVFIITADRPAAVERLLDSMLRAGGLTQFEALFLVDDSREADNRLANEELVARFNTRSAKEFFYVGQKQQQQFAQSLKAELGACDGVHPVDFALGLPFRNGAATYGAARNVCLLLSVGCKALILDDDVLCQGFDFPEVLQVPRIDSSAVSSAYFARDYDSAVAQVKARGDSILGTVEHFTGATLGQALRDLSRPLPTVKSFLGCSGDLAAALDHSSRILVTQLGSVGDPGTEGVGWLAALDVESQQRFLTALADAGGTEIPRICWRGVNAATFAAFGSMSQLTGLDNSELLPPYFPAYRGEDVLFAGLAKLMHPTAKALELPVCVPHLPLESRPSLSLEAGQGTASSLGLAFRFLARDIDLPRSATPAETLERVSDSVAEWAARGDRDTRVLLRSLSAEAVLEQMNRLGAAMNSGLAEPGSAWRGWLQAQHNELQRTLQNPQSLAAASDGPEAAFLLEGLRASAVGFARVLGAWSAMRKAAEVACADVYYKP